MLSSLSSLTASRRSCWIVIGAWLVLVAAMVPLQGPLQSRAADESDTFQVRGSESLKAKQMIDAKFRRGSESAAVIAYFNPNGIGTADRERMNADARAICRSGTIPSLTMVGTPFALGCGKSDPLDLSSGGPGLLTSPDGTVALASALMTDDSTPTSEAAADTIRKIVPAEPDANGLRAYVTGEVGYEADRSEAVKSIDDTLLIVTCSVLILLLLAIYRSPLVALVPLAVVGVAYVVAGGLTYLLVDAGLTTVSGQSAAILIVLMFGAGTDYCLLIVARYRDELRRTGDVHAAMAAATRRTGPAILSAGAIVIAAMLVLVVADFNATREMGPILALGVAVMVAAGLTLLPAILAVLGRRAFWPAVPHVGEASGPGAVWQRVGRLVGAHPKAVAAGVTLVLLGGAAGALGGREPLDFSEAFRTPPESVKGQQVIADRFIPGRAAPINIVTPYDRREAVASKLSEGRATPVADLYVTAASVPPNGQESEFALAQAYLKLNPFSDEATDAVPGLRRAARAAGGAGVLLGGEVPEAYDTREALTRDTRLIVPIGLLLILLILTALLRAVVMPLYVIATVILSFGFALGVSSLVFTHVMGQPASDQSLEQFAFIFLVALGVDYNVFLLARIREERTRRGTTTKQAVVAALERTGGVITSAGLVLAATFSVLMALPLESLFQVGFVVALGLLADTFLVRALLVPSIAILLGERNWWPRTSALVSR